VVRALLAGGIMAAPALGYGTFAVLNEPDHIGTGVPVMVILLLLDRSDRPKLRSYLPLLILVLLEGGFLPAPVAARGACVR
jgi:hypothetical protein